MSVDAPFVIGLTGPIGCGKSTIAAILAELGATVIDADALAREVTAPGEPALAQVRERFGDAVMMPDGALDRAALAALVFADPEALAALERIVHPQVRTRALAALAEAARSEVPIVAIEAIKLIEGGLAERCDELWLIECSPAAQAARLAGRGAAEEDVRRRISAQGPDLAGRLSSRVTRRIVTEGPLNQTRERVEDALADALAPTLVQGAGTGTIGEG